MSESSQSDQTHVAVGISVAAEHRPTLDGATSTHMVLYVTTDVDFELIFPSFVRPAGSFPFKKRSPLQVRGKNSLAGCGVAAEF